jgi:GNAT superfamily N-acetyltransferase
MIEHLDWVASDPASRHRWIKMIDNYAGGGTFPIMGERVLMFADLRTRQAFYEPLSSYDTLLQILRWKQRQTMAGVPSEAQDRVTISFQIFEGAYSAPGGAIELPRAGEGDRGRHAVRVEGWDASGERLVFVNSWGGAWGSRGLGSVSRAYLDRFLHEGWLRRNARYGPSRHNFEPLTSTGSLPDFRRAWMEENPRWRRRLRFGGTRLTQITYEAISAEEGSSAHVIELRSGRGFRLGWAIVIHLPGEPPASVLKELFVWPHFRREGYGRILEQAAVDVATHWHSKELRLLFHAADAIPRSRGAGRVFGEAMGYRWRWVSTTRPALAAVGMKPI